jgi:hypothetical protein
VPLVALGVLVVSVAPARMERRVQSAAPEVLVVPEVLAVQQSLED